MSTRRILLKLSGELLSPSSGAGLDAARVGELARQIADAVEPGTARVAVVMGGGNFLRGVGIAGSGPKRIHADRMGMLATVLNALALEAALEEAGVRSKVFSAIPVADLAEGFVWRTARSLYEDGTVLLLAGGTGHPFFSTDTCAALRALELGADLLAKGTKVRGVYAEDPVENPEARFYERLTFREVLERRLRVMDATAISLCMENGLPILVFNMWEPGNLARVLRGETPGTLIE